MQRRPHIRHCLPGPPANDGHPREHQSEFGVSRYEWRRGLGRFSRDPACLGVNRRGREPFLAHHEAEITALLEGQRVRSGAVVRVDLAGLARLTSEPTCERAKVVSRQLVGVHRVSTAPMGW